MALGAFKGSDEDGTPGGASERSGPVAALIMFLALLLGAVPAAAVPGTGDPLSRASQPRTGRQAPARGAFEQDRGSAVAARAEAAASVPPPTPSIVTEALSARPSTGAAGTAFHSIPRLRAAAYRARAPPAA